MEGKSRVRVIDRIFVSIFEIDNYRPNSFSFVCFDYATEPPLLSNWNSRPNFLCSFSYFKYVAHFAFIGSNFIKRVWWNIRSRWNSFVDSFSSRICFFFFLPEKRTDSLSLVYTMSDYSLILLNVQGLIYIFFISIRMEEEYNRNDLSYYRGGGKKKDNRVEGKRSVNFVANK